MDFAVTTESNGIKITFYTAAFRKAVVEEKYGVFTGRSAVRVPSWKLDRLASGTYYAVIQGRSLKGETAVSRPFVLIVLR